MDWARRRWDHGQRPEGTRKIAVHSSVLSEGGRCWLSERSGCTPCHVCAEGQERARRHKPADGQA